MAPDSTLMAAPVTAKAETFNVGAPIRLFQTRIVGGGIAIDEGRQYDVAQIGAGGMGKVYRARDTRRLFLSRPASILVVTALR
jgi:hypothetical protein